VGGKVEHGGAAQGGEVGVPLELLEKRAVKRDKTAKNETACLSVDTEKGWEATHKQNVIALWRYVRG